MKIGILTNYHLNYVGGAEQVLDRLAHLWHTAGHEVVLFASPGRRRAARRPWQCAYRHVAIARPFSTRFFLSRYLPCLELEHARGGIDVLLACDAYWPGHVARLFHRRSGVPYVICSQGGDCMHGSRFLGRTLCRRRMSLAIRDAAGLACISRYVTSRLTQLAAPSGIVRLIHNGWPDEWSWTLPAPRALPGPYLFSMGRIVELKGFQTLVEAFARVRSRRPDLSLVIAGDGPYLPALTALARRLGLAPQQTLPNERSAAGLFFPGLVHGDEKRSLAHHATLGILPSIREEPQSLALLEMLCGGVPVVASRVGGTPDIVHPGFNGDLFTAGESTELADCLERLLERPDRLAELSHNAATSVEELRWSDVAHRYLNLFAAVLGKQETESLTPNIHFKPADRTGSRELKTSESDRLKANWPASLEPASASGAPAE